MKQKFQPVAKTMKHDIVIINWKLCVIKYSL